MEGTLKADFKQFLRQIYKFHYFSNITQNRQKFCSKRLYKGKENYKDCI